MQYIGFSLEEINNMPIMDRKLYIRMHNDEQKKKNESMSSNDLTRYKNSLDNVQKRGRKKIDRL